MLHAPIIAERSLVPHDATLELAVMIPTRNEVGNVRPLLALLETALGDIVREAIVVDDNSPNGTAALVREIGCGNIRVRVIQRIGRRGLSSAVIEGALATCAPIVAAIDANLQHDETVLPRLFAAVRDARCDLAMGSRYTVGGSFGVGVHLMVLALMLAMGTAFTSAQIAAVIAASSVVTWRR